MVEPAVSILRARTLTNTGSGGIIEKEYLLKQEVSPDECHTAACCRDS